ncbi:MAG: hypothetical protein Q7T89_05525 [Anaerolineales bacterium]|nr:hypothetical protein [Anaerolineales bacterium]
MKKYSVLFAMIALVLASLACQTVMGGGDNFEAPDIQNVPELPQTDDGGEIPTVPPVTTDGDGGVTVGGESEFPVTSDAFNVVTAPDVVTFQTKMSSDDVLKFYRDEFASQGYKEDASMAITFGKTFTLAFNGHASGKVIYVVGADAGDGSLYVTITLG